MRERIEEQLRAVNRIVSEYNIKKIVFWNSKDKKEHEAQEIKKYLESESNQGNGRTF